MKCGTGEGQGIGRVIDEITLKKQKAWKSGLKNEVATP
jgi:hypothetical protein